MVTELSGLPTGVIGFEANGKIEADDYRKVIFPAVEGAARAGQVRFMIVLSDFAGVTGGAMWQDMKLGAEHLTGWKRIAVVSDESWVTHLANLFGWMAPGEMETFPLAERDAAIAWVAG